MVHSIISECQKQSYKILIPNLGEGSCYSFVVVVIVVVVIDDVGIGTPNKSKVYS